MLSEIFTAFFINTAKLAILSKQKAKQEIEYAK
jgi:hypothetical protein